MENKEYLNEDDYQEANKKVNNVGSVLLYLGLILILAGIAIIVLAFTLWNNSMLIGVGAPLIVVGLPLISFGGQAKLIGNARKITAYMTQQQMPIAKEGIEKMAPTAGVVAKEIAKGIKEGLEDK